MYIHRSWTNDETYRFPSLGRTLEGKCNDRNYHAGNGLPC